jgi:hypothetical protein
VKFPEPVVAPWVAVVENLEVGRLRVSFEVDAFEKRGRF